MSLKIIKAFLTVLLLTAKNSKELFVNIYFIHDFVLNIVKATEIFGHENKQQGMVNNPKLEENTEQKPVQE